MWLRQRVPLRRDLRAPFFWLLFGEGLVRTFLWGPGIVTCTETVRADAGPAGVPLFESPTQ